MDIARKASETVLLGKPVMQFNVILYGAFGISLIVEFHNSKC